MLVRNITTRPANIYSPGPGVVRRDLEMPDVRHHDRPHTHRAWCHRGVEPIVANRGMRPGRQRLQALGFCMVELCVGKPFAMVKMVASLGNDAAIRIR